MLPEFQPFEKIARLSRPCTITEKIDGTNGSIYISDDLTEFAVGSRSRWLQASKGSDNHGFAAWAEAHKDELIAALGPGHHFGEWWGAGIQRRYGLDHKRFSLFDTKRWAGVALPDCLHVVPVLYEEVFSTTAVEWALDTLKHVGSMAAPGFMQPEGIVIYHHAANIMFKKTIEKDEVPKTQL